MGILDRGWVWLERRIYPELGRIAPHHRQRAMERARSERFDSVEFIGILAAVAATAYLTRYGVAGMTASGRFLAALLNFVVAVALLVLIAGPFYIRRNRRGLRAFDQSAASRQDGDRSR